MNYSVSHPAVLYLLLLLVPLFFALMRVRKKITHVYGENPSAIAEPVVRNINARFIPRTVLRLFALAFVILALAGISWGTASFPVQKSGKALSLVFDISHSMEATDGFNSQTRLKSAALYAEALLDHIENCSVSVILAKGSGVVAVPMTEDKEAIKGLISMLSPRLMTAQGSSLGGGIAAAIGSFPTQTAEAPFIWLFTDGDETDSALSTALTEALRSGVSVAVIGFGSTEGRDVLTGDKKTSVHTSLKEKDMQNAVQEAQSKSRARGSAVYVNASDPSAAGELFSMLKSQGEENTTVVYEVRSVERKGLFIALALICIILSFIVGELGTKKARLGIGTMLICCIFTTGCARAKNTEGGIAFAEGKRILEGRLAWNKNDYQGATASFLEAEETARIKNNLEAKQYALFNLATTYIMQNENASALNRLKEINTSAPAEVRFATFYNLGIIAHREGDYALAAYYFKQALIVNGSNLNAKINLELSLREANLHKRQQESALNAVSKDDSEKEAMENALYSVIRESEKQQWKNQQTESESSALDY